MPLTGGIFLSTLMLLLCGCKESSTSEENLRLFSELHDELVFKIHIIVSVINCIIGGGGFPVNSELPFGIVSIFHCGSTFE